VKGMELKAGLPMTGPTVGPRTQIAIAVARCSLGTRSAIVPPPERVNVNEGSGSLEV
jgi:hypothetical protein